MLNNLGDGSTLTLDFTTGVLDSRLTFTRASTATFINSSGYVQFANANLMTYSNPRQTGAAWLTSGTVTWGSSTLTDPTGGSAAQSITFGTTTSAVFNTSGTTVASGITHTFSVWMRSATGTTNVRIGDANVGVVATVTLTTTWQRFSCQYTTSGTNDGGAIYSQTGTPSAEFYVWGAQVQPGSIVGELIQTSGTINTNTPRFDHDPDTRAPRGLLVEGQATNICLNGSMAYTATAPTSWVRGFSGCTVASVDSTTFPGQKAWSISATASGQRDLLEQVIALAANTTYTVSVYLEAVTGTVATFAYMTSLPAGATSNTVVNPSAGRISFTVTVAATAGNGTLRIGIGSATGTGVSADASVRFSHVQVETGSGASSYIPTGASTATRVQDLVSITSTNFSSWWTSNNPASFLVDVSSTNRPLANHIFRIADSSGSAYGYQSYFNSTTMPMQVRAAMSSTASSDVAIGSNLAANTRTKIGFTVETASLKRFRDGSLANTLNTPTLPPNMLTQMYIGGTSTFGNSSADFHIRQFKYWPITLSDAVMQGLTT
jgi:hypothetical protein